MKIYSFLIGFIMLYNCINALGQATNNGNELYNTALDLYKTKEWQQALEMSNRAVQAKPTPDAYYLIALCHKKMQSDEFTLRQAYQNVLQIAPNHVPSLTQLGILCYNKKDFADAEKYLQRAQQFAPNDAEVKRFLTAAQSAKQQQAKGKKLNFAETPQAPTPPRMASKGRETDNAPDFIPLYNEAIQYLNDDDFAAAAASLKKAITYAPQNARAHNLLGWAYANMNGEQQNAEKYLAKANRLAPKDSLIWQRTGEAYFVMQNYEKALSAYKKAEKNGLRTAKIYEQLALCCYNSSKEDEAAEWYKAAIAIEPTNAALHYNLGTTLLVLRQWQQGIEALKQAVRYDDTHLEARFNMSRAYYQLVQYDKALEIARETIAINSDYARGYFACGKAYRGLGDVKNADKFLEMAYRLDPKLKLFGF